MASAVRIAPVGRSRYETQLRLIAGLIAGFVSSLSIIVIITVFLVITGNDILTAVRLIASVVIDPNAAGWQPVVIGTLFHLLTGTLLGAGFALIMPHMPPNIFVVVGLIYGILTWGVVALIVLPVIAPTLVATNANVTVLLFAHIAYGFVLGTAAAIIEVLWMLPKASARV